MEFKNRDITIVRGDSGSILVGMYNEDGTVVPFVTGDTVYFTVKTDVNTVTKIFQKTITTFSDGLATVDILPADTKTTPLGRYVYDVQLSKSATNITTLVVPSPFIIVGEVTYE